jgi:hypothetical protein
MPAAAVGASDFIASDDEGIDERNRKDRVRPTRGVHVDK